METPIKKFLFGSLAFAAALGAVLIAVIIRNQVKSYNYIGKTEEMPHTLQVAGEGKVTTVPDIAKIQLGLITKNKDVAAAQKENTNKINKIIQTLKTDFGIKSEDIKTQSYSIYPEYDYKDGTQNLRDYAVSQNLELKIRDLGKISGILQKAGQEGMNQVSGLTFDIDEKEGLKSLARQKAIENARQKAEAIAKAAEVKLGALVSFSESEGSIPPIYKQDYFVSGLEFGGAGGAPEIESGSNEITINVILVFETL